MNEKNHLLDDYFMEYRKMVIRNAYLFVKDYHTAEDICQETFIRLGERLDKIPPEKVSAWLIRVSERLALDYLRKGGRYEISLGIEEYSEEFASDDYSDLSSMMVHKEEAKDRKRVLEKLKQERPLWYEAIVMSNLENMDNSSIGEELGIKANLVSKWKSRARKWLRTKYKEEEEKEDR